MTDKDKLEAALEGLKAKEKQYLEKLCARGLDLGATEYLRGRLAENRQCQNLLAGDPTT